MKDVVDLLQAESPKQACFVNSRGGRWVSIIGRRFMISDDAIEETGSLVSNRLKQPSIGFRVIDSDILCYWVFDRKGALVDRSRPEEPDAPTEEEAKGRGGDPRFIVDIFNEHLTKKDVIEVFEKETLAIETVMYSLADKLSIDSDFPWSYESLAPHDVSFDELEVVERSIHCPSRRKA